MEDRTTYHTGACGLGINIAASDYRELIIRAIRWHADNSVALCIDTGHCAMHAQVRIDALRHLRDEITRALDDHAAAEAAAQEVAA